MFKITREQFFEFIKKKDREVYTELETLTDGTKHYLKYFDKYQSTGKKINWHWPSCFFTTYWCVYRRIYLYLLLYFLLSIPLMLILFLLISPLPQVVVGAIGLLIILGYAYIVPGLYADYVYLRFASKKIAKGKKTSGTNLWALIIVMILGGFLSLIGAISNRGTPSSTASLNNAQEQTEQDKNMDEDAGDTSYV